MAMTPNRVLFLLNLERNQDILEVSRRTGGRANNRPELTSTAKTNDERPRLPQAAPSQPGPVTACRFTRAGLRKLPCPS